MHKLLNENWGKTWQALNASGSGEAYRAQLIAAYSEPQRHYHTLQHLQECLALFEDYQQYAERPAEVAIALWFHDAVYDVKGKDNEWQSAQWATQVLANAGVAEPVRQRVHDLIMATCHQAIPQARDEQVLVDIDLSILGASPERFAEYETQVRKEYQWVPGIIYQQKRKAILKSFLARPSIYQTPAIATDLASQAEENLQRAIT